MVVMRFRRKRGLELALGLCRVRTRITRWSTVLSLGTPESGLKNARISDNTRDNH